MNLKLFFNIFCGKGLISFSHCVKSVHTRSYSVPHFPAFGLNTERYRVSLPIQSEYGKMWTRITPNTDTFHAVSVSCNMHRFLRLDINFREDLLWSRGVVVVTFAQLHLTKPELRFCAGSKPGCGVSEIRDGEDF